MDRTTAQALIALNNRFYREHAASFSATRSAPWAGWERVVSCVRAQHAAGDTLVVLDAACGNRRLERFLARALPDAHLVYQGVDACDVLANGTGATADGTAANGAADGGATAPPRIRYADILGELLADGDPFAGLAPANLTACFGFMHHVPGAALRAELLRTLVRHTAPGGLIALSFWAFMDDERLAAKACRADAAARACPPSPGFAPASLEPGDHFLGWQDDGRALRYCHHGTDQEIDALVATLPAGSVEECARFAADGKTGRLNRYRILRRR